MGIQRKLPPSNEQRNKALDVAKKKKDTVPPADNVVTPATGVRLDAIQPLYKAGMLDVGVKLAAQSASTAVVKTTMAKARMYVSHFFQSFNNGVDRGMFPAADRAFYQLDVNSNSVPSLDSEALVILWGERIRDGDALRVAAGGAAMAMPTAAEVNVQLTAFVTANNDQSTKKLAYDHAQEAVDALNPEADGVIKKLWDEAETFYNEEPIASRRRKCREWGVVYISDIPNIIHLTVLNVADDSPLFEADAEVTETGDHFLTDGAGKTDVKTTLAEQATLHVTHADFVAQDAVVDFTAGGHEFTVVVKLVHV